MSRITLRHLLLLALALALPSLWVGFLLDDYMHLLLLQGGPGVGGAWDLYRFSDGDPEHMRPFIERGPYTWWTNPDLLMAFWRPLASASANLDHALFGSWAPGYHLHSVMWWLGTVAAVWAWMKRALPGPLGVLAVLLFTLDDAHVQPIVWVANRNALIATLPAVLGLTAHLRWREQGWRWGLPLSLAGLSVGLLGGETALGVCAYWGSYELLAGPGKLKERLVALAPATALGLVYLLLHSSLNYGAVGSGIYVDPRFEPLQWMGVAPARALALLGGQLLGSPADLWLLLPSSRPVLVLAGALGVALTAGALKLAWPTFTPEERRALRWLAPGAALSMAPILSTFPLTRLLLVPSLGAAAVVAMALGGLWRLGGGRLRWTLLAVLAPIHLALAPLALLGQTLALGLVARTFDAMAANAELDGPAVSEQTFILLSAPDPITGFYPTIMRATWGEPLPHAWWLLSMAPADHRMTRTGERSFELEVLDGTMLTTTFELLFFDPHLTEFDVGWSAELSGGRVTVLELSEGLPKRVRVDTELSLDDPKVVLLRVEEGDLRQVEAPSVGEGLELPFNLELFGVGGF